MADDYIDRERQKIQVTVAAIPDQKVGAGILAEFEALASAWPTVQVQDQPSARAKIEQLQKDALIASNMSSDLSWGAVILIVVGIVVFVISLWGYFIGIGSARYATIEATRPVLVFTLIVAMLGFGGLLIVRSLFSPQGIDALQERFRLAREVFLVYAGIFGTIIGFYFGAADKQVATDPPTLGAPAVRGGRLSVGVEGGTEPFTVLFTLSKETGGTQMTGQGRNFSIRLANGAPCPVGGTIDLVDGTGRRAETKIEEKSCSQPEAVVGKDTAPANVSATGNLPDANVTASGNLSQVTPVANRVR